MAQNFTGYMPTAIQPQMNLNPYYQTQMPTQQVSQNNQTSIMTIFVSSEDEVVNYPVAAGVTVLLISFNLQKFWIKSTSTNGVPQPVRIFDFKEKVQTPQVQNTGVSREEFMNLSEQVKKLIQELGGTGNDK